MVAIVADNKNPSAVEATVALQQIDPANAILQTTGIALLLVDLTPTAEQLKEGVPRRPDRESAAALVGLGAVAVKPLMQQLSRNNPKTQFENRGPQATATRYFAYLLLQDLADKAKKDEKLVSALKEHGDSLRLFWDPQERHLAEQARQTAGFDVSTRELYIRTAQAAHQANLAIAYLRYKAK